MDLQKYPVLEDHISASEIRTPQENELLIYNTLTGEKKHPNRAVFTFLQVATGENTFEEIVALLSQQSGESFDKIWPNLHALAADMIEEYLLKVSDSPLNYPRTPPCSVELKRRLESVSLETTRQCNLQCKHCYADADSKTEDELTTPEIKHLIDELADMGVLSLTFTGGEPLLHPDLFELMEYARKKPMTVLLFTNGVVIDEDIVTKLKELPVFRVNISIDGADEKTHDEFRRRKGAFKKSINAVSLLKKANIPVDISISVHKENYTQIKEILSLLKKMEVNEYKLWPITFTGRPEKEDIFVTSQEFKKVMEASREFEFEEMGRKEKEEFKYSESVENCGVAQGGLAIKCDGMVTPCPIFGADVSLGNIREQSVADIWNNSPLLKKLRSISVYECEPCRDCEFAAVCKGGCIGDIYGRSEKKEFSCYDPYVCVGFEVFKNDFIPVKVDDTKSSSLSVEMV